MKMCCDFCVIEVRLNGKGCVRARGHKVTRSMLTYIYKSIVISVVTLDESCCCCRSQMSEQGMT